MNKIIDNIPRLQWACRRGMLELDVLLGNFLNEAYPGLSSSEKEVFVALLENTDPELFAWLMGNEKPDHAALAEMVERIRQHARTRI